MRLDHSLHRARIGRRLSIDEIAAASLLPVGTVLKIDEGRFDELPPGIYARSYVRQFASAVGIEPDRALAELAEVIPAAPDPFTVLRELKGTAAPWSRSWSVPTLDLGWHVESMRLAAWLGAGIDAAMLLAINAVVIGLTAYISGLPVALLLQHASAAVAPVCAVPMTLYFVLFGGIAGRTPGAMVCRVPEMPASTPLGLRTILLRAFS